MPHTIALISDHASPLAALGGVDSGGQNVYVNKVAHHLALLGYQVDVFTRRDSDHLPESVQLAEQVRVIHVPAGPPCPLPKEMLLEWMDDFTAFILHYCARQPRPYTLLHANFWMSGLVAAEVKRVLGIPFVVTFHALGRVRRLHQGPADGFPDRRFEIEERIVTEADGILAQCPQDREDLLTLYHADPARLSIVPCGFDPTEFWPIPQAEARQHLGVAPHDFLILQLGRLVPRKGVDTVIRSLAQLVHKQKVSAHLLIVGGESEEPDPRRTPEIARLQTIALQESVADRVTFVGRRGRDRLRLYYSAADLFVTTPWYEPFGITPLEAMACGTPVIGSRVGGIQYTVREGETGFLVPPQQPAALAACLARLLQEPDLRHRLGQQAIQHVNRHFTWEKVATRLADAYERVIVASQPAARGDTDPLAIVDRGFEAVIEALQQARYLLRASIGAAAEALQACFARGGKVLVCGNGGSAAEAQHFAAELVGRFRCANRPALPVLSLTADSAILTAWSNDVGYEQVFARQIEALGQATDLLLAISTSGCSRNLIEAMRAARRRGMPCIALLGGNGGEMLRLADVVVLVPAEETPRIQEVQVLVLHLLCELVEAGMMAVTSAAVAA